MTARRRLAIILAPLVLAKLLRITNFVVFMTKFAKAIFAFSALPGINATASFKVLWDNTPYPKIEWFLQIFDNWYVS